MNVDIICVGKVKEKYLRDGIAEYKKRLSKFCRLNIIEVEDEKTIDKQSEALDERVKLIEGERILKHISENDYVITLEIQGKMLSSEELALKIDSLCVSGVSRIKFVIGGSLGLHEKVLEKSKFHLSFSQMTFPHQLMRLITLEQIYRCFKINNNEPYHK